MTVSNLLEVLTILSSLFGAILIVFKLGISANQLMDKLHDVSEAQQKTTTEVESVRGDLVRATNELHKLNGLTDIIKTTVDGHGTRLNRLEHHVDNLRSTGN